MYLYGSSFWHGRIDLYSFIVRCDDWHRVLDKLQTGNSSLYPFQLTFKPLITMLPVVAGSSSFTIIDDVWNSFSFDVQGSLIPTWLLSIGHYSIEYDIPVFILVAVGCAFTSSSSLGLMSLSSFSLKNVSRNNRSRPMKVQYSISSLYGRYSVQYRPKTNQPNLWRVDFWTSLDWMENCNLKSSSLLIAHNKKIRDRLD